MIKSSIVNKSDQLVALLKKPNGTRLTVIVNKLDWQAHTVRAAISGLRKKGFAVTCKKSKKDGEAVYSILPQSSADGAANGRVEE